MQIEKIGIERLKPAKYNPRKELKPSDPEFEKLKNSITEFGYIEPVIWNQRTGNVVGGHQRLSVLKHLEETEVDCIVVDMDLQKEKALNIEIVKSVDGESHIQTLEIYKSNDGGDTWVLVEKDDYGTPVTIDNLKYAFRTTGIYKAIVTDEFRTVIDAITAQFDYSQNSPVGTLIGVDNNGYTNGTVKFEWTDEATVTLTKDGEEIRYTLGDEITEAGSYKVVVTDEVGNTAEYTFTIEKSLGAGAIIGIIFGCMILVGGIVVVVLKKEEII